MSAPRRFGRPIASLAFVSAVTAALTGCATSAPVGDEYTQICVDRENDRVEDAECLAQNAPMDYDRDDFGGGSFMFFYVSHGHHVPAVGHRVPRNAGTYRSRGLTKIKTTPGSPIKRGGLGVPAAKNNPPADSGGKNGGAGVKNGGGAVKGGGSAGS